MEAVRATFEAILGTHAGITKIYEAATHYCGWHFIEAGKTMGLAPYGEPKYVDELRNIGLDRRKQSWVVSEFLCAYIISI